MHDSTVNVISWNMAHKREPWRRLVDMDIDLALLQEACRPPDDIAERFEVDPAPWSVLERDSRVKWPTAIAVVSNRVTVELLTAKPIGQAALGELAVSSPGTLTAARVMPRSGEPFIAVSIYAELEHPLKDEGTWISRTPRLIGLSRIWRYSSGGSADTGLLPQATLTSCGSGYDADPVPREQGTGSMVWHCSTLGGARKRLKEERRALKQVRESWRLRCHLLFGAEF